MSFKDRALPLIDKGIAVIPVRPGEKRGVLANWPALASTDPAQIMAWDRQNPAYNTGAVGKLGHFVILDADTGDLADMIAKQTGNTLPATFTVRSAGKQLPHYYFRHTPLSNTIGNRKLLGKFDLQANDRYVVGPGSVLTTPGGPRTYDVIDESPIVPIPDWLVSWIESVTTPEKALSASSSTAMASEKFDIHAFLDHYGLGYRSDGNWYITDVCPVSGRKHEQSTRTGFYWDGEKFGFNCFASGCPGHDMTVGDVIRHLNTKGGLELRKPYTGEIWPSQEALAPETKAVLLDPDWPMPLSKFRAKHFPPRTSLLVDTKSPAGENTVLWSESVNQIFSFRGVGKSLFANALVGALAKGSSLMRYQAPKPVKVLLVDGELPNIQLQERLNTHVGATDNVWLISTGIMPNQELRSIAKDADFRNNLIERIDRLKPQVVLFDTLTACFRFDTNDAEQWETVNKFYITLRNKGYCVIVVHHAGKNGTQRGRTDGDDNLDLVMKLTATGDSSTGLQFNLEYDKLRAGGRLEPFCAKYDNNEWTEFVPQDQEELISKVVQLQLKGKSIREIAKALEIDRNKVSRILKKQTKEGTTVTA